MQRKDFIKYGAGFLLIPGCSSQKDTYILKDVILRANPAILPTEREEKRIFDNSNSEFVKWGITLCTEKSAINPTNFSIDMAYIESLATDESVPYVIFNAKLDINYTDKKGLYLSFSVGTRLLEMPKHKPKELLSTTSNYFNCLNDLRQKKVDCEKCQSIDLRQVRVISDEKIYHAKQFVHRPTKNGILIDAPPVLMDIEGVHEFSKSTWNILFFEISQRPIRFKLIPPPLYFKGIKIPLPICFFEPYDVAAGKWA